MRAPLRAVPSRLTLAATISIPRRFNGPPDSANGGYVCGTIAAALGADAAEVTLRSPPPLETTLSVEEETDGAVAVRHGDVLVAEGRPVELELEVPHPPGTTAAGEAACAGYTRWSESHPFPSCFVCGPEREAGDGMRIFPGRLDGTDLWASTWTPDPSLAEEGLVREECVWAALDCPTSAPAANYGWGPPIVLGRFAAAVAGDVRAGQPHVVISWALGADGRKRHSGSALFDQDGRLLARARALWIELQA